MILVRDARDSDLPAITAVYAREVLEGASSYEYEAPGESEMGVRMRAVLDAGNPYLVAELDGAFAGYAYANAYRNRAGYRCTVEDTVYVAAGSAGHGVGTALLGRLIEQCELRGYRQMVAVIGDAGNAASVSLHRKHGFETVGIFKGLGRKHGRWLDNLQMQRALGAGCATPPTEP